MVDFRSQTTVPPLRSQATGSALRSSAAQTPFASTIPAERRFKVADLFKFQRGRADLLFSVLKPVLPSTVRARTSPSP